MDKKEGKGIFYYFNYGNKYDEIGKMIKKRKRNLLL